ncbi:DUF547 domain-containing protein [Thalassotalea euphylliae]|nr:DUF547 domain-containing protein [Thalassotalea euphylliae]
MTVLNAAKPAQAKPHPNKLDRSALFEVIFGLLVACTMLLATLGYDLYQARTAKPIGYWQLNQEAFAADNTKTIAHQSWQQLLAKYARYSNQLSATVFDYRAVSEQDKQQLNAYLQALQDIDPRTFNHREQFAYWINLYNALTVKLVLDHYPIASIREIHQLPFDSLGEIIGPWDIKVAQVAGQALSLNQIEHGILRSIWQEPRVHYVINCASRGCPNLPLQVITANELEQQLNTAAKAFVNHPRAVNLVGSQLTLSSIYNWFGVDFGEDHNALLAHLIRYAEPELASALTKFNGDINYQYNWQLNQPIDAALNTAMQNLDKTTIETQDDNN